MAEIKVTDNATGYAANFLIPPGVRPQKIHKALAKLAKGESVIAAIFLAALKPHEAKFFRTLVAAWTEARTKHALIVNDNLKTATEEATAAGKKPKGVKIFPDGKVELVYEEPSVLEKIEGGRMSDEVKP